MSSTHPFTPFIRDRRPWLLKTLLAVHISILTTNLFLLLQLIAHMAATQGKENFDMPPRWKKGFVGQAVGGSKMGIWVVVFLLVPVDLLVALGFVEWYGKMIQEGKRKTEDGRKRKEIERWIMEVCGRVARWRKKQFWGAGPEQDERANDDTEQEPAGSSASSHFASTKPSPGILRALLFPYLNPLERLLLHTLWSTLMIPILTSHIYIFATNLAPSLSFCSEHPYSHWSFKDHDPGGKSKYQPGFSLEDRCKRMNWTIWIAGGYSAGSAGILAGLHFFALLLRLFEYGMGWWGAGKGKGDKRKGKGRPDESGEDIEMQDWACPPRDIDVRPRKSSIRGGDEGETTGRVSTISQEEANVGVGRRRGRRGEEGSDTQESKSTGASGKWDRWMRSEGWFECLLE